MAEFELCNIGLQMSGSFQFCLMLPGDLDEVMAIEHLAYPIPWTRSMFETSLSSKDECWLLKVGDSILGYTIISNVLDEAHLLNICIHPKFSRKGYGRTLLRYVIERAIERKACMFFLEVRVSNKYAINLYFSEGFNEVGIRPNYYPSSKGVSEDALLMTLELSIDQYV